jgi:four helix bundle protein
MEYKQYNFEKLEVYKLSEELVIKVYTLLKTFPANELYGLVSQIKRAVVSIALNIAEGATSRSSKDFARFLQIAIGSLVEAKSGLMTSIKLNFLKQNEFETLLPKIDELFFKLMALKKSLYGK